MSESRGVKQEAAGVRESQRFVCEFIELYKEQPCLWKYSCKDYRNRTVKERAYEALVLKMREVDPRADKNSVMRKINALRTAFRREFKKVRRTAILARTIGAAAGGGGKCPRKKYTPSLWYYDLLTFVVDQQDLTDPLPGPAVIADWQYGGESYTSVDVDGKVVHHTEALMEYLEDAVCLCNMDTYMISSALKEHVARPRFRLRVSAYSRNRS